MSDLETIVNSLRGLVDGGGQAEQAAAGAAIRAQEIAGRAAMSGFVAIAIGMQQVEQAVHEVRQRLSSVTHGLTGALATMQGAAGKPTPSETIGLLSAASEQIGTTQNVLGGLVGQVTQVQQQAAAVLHGGQPGPMINALDQVAQAIAEVVQQCGTTQQALAAAITQAQQLGDGGN